MAQGLDVQREDRSDETLEIIIIIIFVKFNLKTHKDSPLYSRMFQVAYKVKKQMDSFTLLIKNYTPIIIIIINQLLYEKTPAYSPARASLVIKLCRTCPANRTSTASGRSPRFRGSPCVFRPSILHSSSCPKTSCLSRDPTSYNCCNNRGDMLCTVHSARRFFREAYYSI